MADTITTPPVRRQRRQVIVATVVLLVTLLAGLGLGAWLESTNKVDIHVTCVSPGARPDVTTKHLTPGSSFTKECVTQ